MSSSPPINLWKKFRHRLEWLGCFLLARSVPLLPRGACVALANALGSLAFRFDKKSRAVALANLACAFGDRYSLAERHEIARRSFQNFARTILDIFWGKRLTSQNWRDYIEIDENVESFLRERKSDPAHGSVFMCIHWGNFEWASLAFGLMDVPTTIVAENFKNARLSSLFQEARQGSGHTIIPQENSMLRLLKVVKRRGMTGMLIDLTLRPEQAAVAIETLGRKMSVTFLHAALAQRGGAKLVPVDGIPLPDGRLKLVIHPPLAFDPEASPQQIAQICWNFFEPRIHEKPELYLWAYKHWRYRTEADLATDYPFYSNVSCAFEQIVAGEGVPQSLRPSARKQRADLAPE